jgi:hypothetical protein
MKRKQFVIGQGLGSVPRGCNGVISVSKNKIIRVLPLCKDKRLYKVNNRQNFDI